MEYQLRGQGNPHLLEEVSAEIQNVRRDAGYPALAMPASEILGTQAVLNVLQGKYKVMTSEFADLMLGYYGTALGEKNAGGGGNGGRKGEQAGHQLPSRRLTRARMGTAARGGFGAARLQRFRRRCLDLHHVLQKPRRSFSRPGRPAQRTSARNRLATQGSEVAAQPVSAGGEVGPSSQTYIVRVNGEEHKVTVTPAQS